MKQPDLGGSLRQLGLTPADRQVDSLTALGDLLAVRGVKLGLIADSDAERIADRHVLDCARAVPFPEEDGRVADLGSGAGLPGLVVAILRPDLEVLLIERRGRRAAFLEWAIERLGVGNASVLAGDVQQGPSGTFQACYARAFAPLEQAWALALPLLAPRLGSGPALLVYFAGAATEVPATLQGASSVRTIPPPRVVPDAGPLVIIRA